MILPAGTYTIGRVSLEPHSTIAISGYGHGALVLPIAIDGPRAKQPKLSFEHVGDKYFLSEVDTPGGIYTFAFTAGDGCAGADEGSRHYVLRWH